MTIHHANAGRRRGVLLLLVLSMLTVFLMLGALMLVLASRARTSARAFATASTAVSRDDVGARAALDEALMQLLRGPAAGVVGSPISESILADRYGSTVTQGTLTGLTQVNSGTLRATLAGVPAATPLALNGRLLTIRPPLADPAPISSFRIVSFTGGTVELANLRTSMPFRTLPAAGSSCTAIVNGREFDNVGGDEPWDETDGSNLFLTKARLEDADATILVTRPAFGTDGLAAYQVDNDGDGREDGNWLANVLQPQPLENGGTRTYRVSYLVLDMDGRFNVNAHGLRNGFSDSGLGPASVSGSAVFGGGWDRILGGTGVNVPPASSLSVQQRRPTPVLGYDVNGRFGTTANTTSQYDLRLDFDGPRPGCPSLAGERVAVAAMGSLFTAGELERVMRPFDADTAALPPRLAGILGDDAQKARMRVTTDSWDTTGLVGSAATAIAAVSATTGLPPDVIAGRRFDINSGAVDTEAAKRAFFHQLLAVALAVGAPNDTATVQWAANAAEFRDSSADTTSYTTNATYAGIAIPTPITVTGHEAMEYGGLGGNTADQRFTSIGQLLCVPRGSQSQLADPACLPDLKRSLAVDYPAILDAVRVNSPFAATVAANPWREPGRVNVNTCDEDVWKAVLGESSAPPNPFNPAQSTGDVLTRTILLFSNPYRPYTSVNTTRANRLANIATTRSNVFAVWVTVEITDSTAPDQKTYRRLFAIVDRSIPVGFQPGVNLNARDTLRLVRYLE
jgi:hypothetical protein